MAALQLKTRLPQICRMREGGKKKDPKISISKDQICFTERGWQKRTEQSYLLWLVHIICASQKIYEFDR